MNFSAWAIRNPVAPLLAFFLLMVMGINSFNTLPITRFPNIDVPVVSVTITQSGATPSDLESQVTKEVEDAVSGISGVDTINSTITDGSSQTVILFDVDVVTNQALQDVKDAVDRIRSTLPASIDEPIVSKIDVEGQAIQTYAVSSPNMTLEELSWYVDDTVKRALQGQPGVGRIDRFGGADREIRVELDPLKLQSFGISASDVNSQLRVTNLDTGSGRSQIAGGEQTIRTLGDAHSVEQLANTTISVGSGRFVKLADLGAIKDTYEEQKSFSRFDGDPVVTFAVFRSKGASEVTVAEGVTEALKKLRAENPNVKIELVNDSVYFTYANYESAIHTLIEGAILAVIVVFLFLRNWRATLISAVALPLSAIPTFMIMDMMGFSLNMVSFLALTLATGILVDDAIVEIENIARHIHMGKTPYRAAIDAADEIGLAVIATTFTIIAVFAPVSFMPGIPGQYFIQFGLTVAFSVFFSLLVARLITPMMAAYLMRAGDVAEDHEGADGFIMRGYTRVVRATTGHWYSRFATMIGAIIFLVASVGLLMQVPGSFMPPEDAGRITLSLELPPNASLEETEATTTEIYNRVKDIDGVADVFVLGGSSPKGELAISRASVTLLLYHKEDSLITALVNDVAGNLPLIGPYLPKVKAEGRTIPQWDIEAKVFAKLRDIPDIRLLKLNDRGDRDLSFSLLADTDEQLSEGTAIMESTLRKEPVLANVSSEGALPRSELRIKPNDDLIARLGITVQQISQTIRVATIGDTDASLAKISLEGRQIPIRVMFNKDMRKDLAAIKALRIRTSSGATVPLASIADIVYSEGPATIKRQDRNRVVTIGADLPQGVALDTATARFKAAESKLPPGVRFVESGDAKVQAEMVQSFINAMILGLLLVLMVLILLFKDVIQPFTILLSLPLAIGGVAAGLILTNNSLSMPVLIGILMLMGIVTKNAILLIDFAIEMRNQGMHRLQAMVEAGRKRARPIVMTSIAMSAGMLPSALGVGEGGSFRSPMAIAVIGGIIVSTVLSLVVVPAFFLIMDDVSRGLGWLFGRFIGKKDEDDSILSGEELQETVVHTARTVGSLEERVSQLEGKKKGSNIVNLNSMAAE